MVCGSYSLAEDEGKVVLCFLLVAQVLQAQPLQKTDHTLVVYGEVSP